MVTSRRFLASFVVCITSLFLAVVSRAGTGDDRHALRRRAGQLGRDASRRDRNGHASGHHAEARNGLGRTRRICAAGSTAWHVHDQDRAFGIQTYENTGLNLSAGQTVRQTFALEVGALAETVTVAENAPLIETATTAQVQSLGEEVREIPVSRRNLQNVILLGSGISSPDSAVGGGRAFRVNGVGDGGSAITVDGSSAQTNPENRGFGNYGGQNQIEILSVEAVAEVQVAKGVLPAEYGGSIGGQVNMITRSGTNQFHGSVFENFQSDAFSSRDPFLPSTTAKPEIKFNQFGGSLGGPILQNRVLFFTSYEGYREESGVTVQGNVATQATRNRMMTALPYPETKMVLDNMPLPNVPINDVIGRYTDARTLTRRDNTFLGKVDFQAGAGRLSVTASRMRPFANVPRIQIENDQQYTNGSKRLSTNYVMTRNSWVSESRFGWNRNTLDRFDEFWLAESPTRGAQADLYNVRKRISTFSVTGFFGSGDTEILALTYDAYNLDQKLTRVAGPHTMKVGFRWAREIGFKSNPQTNRFTFASVDDLLANKASDFLLAMGNPPHQSVGRSVRRLHPGRLARHREVRAQPGSALRLLPGIWVQIHGSERSGGGQQSEQSDRHPQDGFRCAAPSGQAD